MKVYGLQMDTLSISAYLWRGFEVESKLHRHIQMEQLIVLSNWDPIAQPFDGSELMKFNAICEVICPNLKSSQQCKWWLHIVELSSGQLLNEDGLLKFEYLWL